MALPSRGDVGATVVEAVVIVPIAMLVVLFAVQACIWAHAATLVENAATQGVQAATAQGDSPTEGSVQARSLLSTTAGPLVQDPAVQTQLLPGGVVRLAVSGDAESIIPGVRLPVSAVRIGLIQEFRQSG